VDVAAYPPAIHALLAADRRPALGPGRPDAAARPALKALTVETLFGPAEVRRPELARCCLAALWLHHDYLDESHAISQDIPGADGSYWHGILHRREPDYANAGYWFRRVGKHSVFEPLHRRAAELTGEADTPPGSEFLARQAAWDPFAFIDLCEAVAGGKAECELLCRQIQRAEWELLFAYCYERAIAIAG
jgi:hypothetical protein